MRTRLQKHSWERWTKSAQLGARSSHWTIAVANSWYWFAILGITIFHTALAAYLPPTEDELYYWTWAKALQWSYFDHPPMVAYIIATFTKIFGNSLLAIRLGAVVISTLVILLMSVIAQKKGILTLFLLTPIFLVGATLMTPDVPLVLFWAAYVLWLSSLNETMAQWSGDPVTRVYRQNPIPLGRWAIGGICLGLGLLSKYTMFLAVPCTFGVLFTKYRGRAWLGGFAFHLLVAAFVALPVWIFNFQHHFQPLAFQFDHAMAGAADVSLKRLFEFVGVQTLLLGGLPFLFLPWIVARGRELCNEPKTQVAFYFFVFPLLFLLYQSTRAQLEANWAIVAYVTLPALAQRVLDRTSFKPAARTIVAVSFIPSILCSAFLLTHIAFPLKVVPLYKDRIGKLRGHYEMSEAVAADVRALAPPLPVFSPNYQWTAYFRYQGLDAQQIFPSARTSEYTVAPQRMCDRPAILIFSDTPVADLPLTAKECFPKNQILKEYPLMIRGQEASRFYLVKYWR